MEQQADTYKSNALYRAVIFTVSEDPVRGQYVITGENNRILALY